MIKKSSLMIFIILFLSIIFITNCSDDDEKDTLIGTWVLTSMKMSASGITVTVDPAEMGLSQTLTIYDDNTFRMVMTEDGETSTSTGEWSSSGGKLYITEEGETEVVDYSLKGDKLEITFEETEEGQTITITQIFTRQ